LPRPVTHLLHMLLIQNLLNRQEFDESPCPSMKRRAFVVGVSAVSDRYEESALSSDFAFSSVTASEEPMCGLTCRAVYRL